MMGAMGTATTRLRRGQPQACPSKQMPPATLRNHRFQAHVLPMLRWKACLLRRRHRSNSSHLDTVNMTLLGGSTSCQYQVPCPPSNCASYHHQGRSLMPAARRVTCNIPFTQISIQKRSTTQQRGTVVAAAAAELVSLATTSDWLYEAAQAADDFVACQLVRVTPLTYATVLGAGLVTSLSPCTLSVLPLTIGYIGGYSKAKEQGADGTAVARSAPNPAVQAASFSLGLATTLAGLGVVSSSIGAAYGAIGDGLPIAVSVLAIVMGLNLLEVLPLNLPSLNVDTREAAGSLPPALQAYLAGLAFALAASPCSTPVLATLLAWVAASQDPVTGGLLLLTYTSGYVVPLLLAATVTGSLKQLLALRQYSAWITPASGALLVGGGTYTLLSRLL